MDRRQFLRSSSTLALTLPLAGFPDRVHQVAEERVLLHSEILNGLGDPGLRRRLGLRYRATCPEENDPLLLREVLRHEVSDVTGATLPTRLQARIRRNFAPGRTVISASSEREQWESPSPVSGPDGKSE